MEVTIESITFKGNEAKIVLKCEAETAVDLVGACGQKAIAKFTIAQADLFKPTQREAAA